MIDLSHKITPKVILLWIAIIVISLFSFIIRTLPAYFGNTDILTNVGMDDPTYHLRQIEQMLANYPNYAWFDPMTYYPDGQPMHWGPLFTFICATVCILAGATTRPDIISVSLFIPGVMAALLVPVVYLLVQKISDWKAGLIAGFFIAIAPGQIFFRSYYGYLDHHIGEVLFGALFCLCYLAAIVYTRKNPVMLDDKETWKKPVVLGLLCGLVYAIGLSLMPTMILFALLVGFFTPFWFLIQRYTGHLGASALVINTTTFLVAIIGFFFIGIKAEGGLNYYTIGHPAVYALMIIGTIILFSFSYYLRNRPFLHYVGSLLGVSLLGIILLAVLMPDFFSYLLANAVSFFGQEIHWKTIQEARQWSIEDAWSTFQFSLFLFAAGVMVLLYRLKKELCPSHLFVLIWSLVILYATWQHIRYEYYLAVPMAILGGISIGFAIDTVFSKKSLPITEPDRTETKKSSKKDSKSPEPVQDKPSFIRKSSCGIFLILLVICGGLFSWIALERDLSIGAFNLNPDWREATVWLGANTPDTGVDYLKIYTKEEWQPPEQSYGVMSWWDYGHIILYLSQRMPNANPFQYGVDGDYGAARFFITQNESIATGILDKLNSRYVITDYEMDTGKFWAMSTWDNPEVGATPYQRTYAIPDPDNPNSVTNYPLFQDAYYKTTVSRLHNFDGSMKEPELVHYLQYVKPEYSGIGIPLVVNGAQMNYSDATALMESFDPEMYPEYNQTLVNYIYTDPVSPVPALQHFRLIHESPSRVSPSVMPDIRYVKIFEYVPGAVIPGEGILEIDVRTNTGREFTYRQESIDGKFIVPYPTETSVGDVITLGPYQNTMTGEVWKVTEEQVQNGQQVV